MKLENLDTPTSNRLAVNYRRACETLNSINNLLLQGRQDTDGGGTMQRKALPAFYSLYLTEFCDGSTPMLDLTGLCMTRPLLEYIKSRLETKIKEMVKEIEAL